MPTLPVGSVVGSYEIRGVLGAGGFGITYLAVHLNTRGKVAIKEYLPRQHAHRDSESRVVPNAGEGSLDAETFRFGLERFLREAQSLEQVQHPYIVRVRDYFEANGTAYLVMNYAEGQTLESWLSRQEGAPDEKMLLEVFMPLLDGLHEVHSRELVHRDIKPSNIYLCSDGTPLLIDFGAARSTLDQHGHVTMVFTPGYSPGEQYGTSVDLPGPRTDLYAVGATLMRCICGKEPPDADTRSRLLEGGGPDPLPLVADLAAGRYSAPFLNAIDHCLARNVEHRPADVRILQSYLSGKVDPGRFGAEPRGAGRDVPTTRRSSRESARASSAPVPASDFQDESDSAGAKTTLRQKVDEGSGRSGGSFLATGLVGGPEPYPGDVRGVGSPVESGDDEAGIGSIARGNHKRPSSSSVLGVALPVSVLLLVGVLAGEAIASPFFETGRLLNGIGNVLCLLCLTLVFTPLGKVRLGGEDAIPDHGRLAWFSMLLTAGVGVGFPLYHVHSGDGPTVGTLYQWGFQVWAIHAVLALSLALLAFNRGLPLAFRSHLHAVTDRAMTRFVGRAVDSLAVFVTVCGLSLVLGSGALLLANELFEPDRVKVLAFLGIVSITVVTLGLVRLGLEKGLKVASLANLLVAAPLLALAFYNSETSGFLWNVVDAPSDYLDSVLPTSETVGAEPVSGGRSAWSWYWLPWIACSPFAGIFTARISHGRTVRELLLGVFIAPSIVGLLWLTALESHYHRSLYGMVWDQAPRGLDLVLYPVGLLAIAMFLVTSLASGAMAMATISAGGRIDGSVPQRILWCVLLGSSGAAMVFLDSDRLFGFVAVPAVLAFFLLLPPMCVAAIDLLRRERAQLRQERDTRIRTVDR